jgi:hypothetical protein
MGVLCEAISVVVKVSSITEKAEGGISAFENNIDDYVHCSDGELYSVFCFSPSQVEALLHTLRRSGLVFLSEDETDDVVVVDMLQGATTECDWVEFARVAFEDGKVAIAWLFEGERLPVSGLHVPSKGLTLHTPAGWEFSNSLSKSHVFVAKDEVN